MPARRPHPPRGLVVVAHVRAISAPGSRTTDGRPRSIACREDPLPPAWYRSPRRGRPPQNLTGRAVALGASSALVPRQAVPRVAGHVHAHAASPGLLASSRAHRHLQGERLRCHAPLPTRLRARCKTSDQLRRLPRARASCFTDRRGAQIRAALAPQLPVRPGFRPTSARTSACVPPARSRRRRSRVARCQHVREWIEGAVLARGVQCQHCNAGSRATLGRGSTIATRCCRARRRRRAHRRWLRVT